MNKFSLSFGAFFLCVSQLPATTTLNSFDITPTVVDAIDSPGSVEISLSLSDSIGISYFFTSFTTPNGWNDYYLDSDDMPGFTEGMLEYSGSVDQEIQKGIIPGEYYIWELRVYDMEGHRTEFDSLALADMGFPNKFYVNSIQDTIPPVLESLTIFTDTVDVNSPDNRFNMSLSISDENSGLYYFGVVCTSPNGRDELQLSTPIIPERPDVFTTSLSEEILPFVEAGTWVIDRISISDQEYNYVLYDTDTLATLGFPTQFEVISVEDYHAPVLTGFSFTPDSIGRYGDDTRDSIQVQLSVQDGVSGIAQILVRFESPISSSSSTSYIFGHFEFQEGTLQYSGSSHAFVWLPAKPGVWLANIILTDIDDNTHTYGPGELDSLGFPSRLTLGHAGPVFHVSTLGDDDTADGSETRPFASIRAAMNSTRSGDTVLVADGIYTGYGNRHLEMPSVWTKTIAVTSENGPQNTILDCEFQDPGFYLVDRYGAETLIDGFTILNGQGEYGGGICIQSHQAPITISNMIIKNCSAEYGGGLYLLDYSSNSGPGSGPTLLNCRIENNTAEKFGGGLYIYDGQDVGGYTPIISNCIFTRNTALEKGGGLYISQVKVYLINSQITFNYAYQGGGIYSQGKVYLNWPNYTSLIMMNSNLVSNTATIEGTGLYAYNSTNTVFNSIIWENDMAGDTLTVSYSNIEGGWPGEGNINAYPRFTDYDNGDFSLGPNSDCIDSGNPDVLYSDNDGSPNDMGHLGGRKLLKSTEHYVFPVTGALESGHNSRQAAVSILNLGQNPVFIEAASFSTPNFSLLDEPFPRTLPPVAADTINVSFHPQEGGELHDDLAIQIGDLGQTHISFEGQGRLESTLYGSIKGRLSKESSPYVIVDDVFIEEGDSLIIEPGVEIRFDGFHAFYVEGLLTAVGTENDSIIFTRHQNNDESRGRGIRFFSADDGCELSYCRIEYGTAQMSGFGSSSTFQGGGVYVSNSNPEISHCTITNNIASGYRGSGLVVVGSTKSPTITHCLFENNLGRAISCNNSNPLIRNSIVKNNPGGGIFIGSASPVLQNVTFQGNEQAIKIEADYDEVSLPIFDHCLITDNTARTRGAAIYCTNASSSPRFINCTIANNTLEWGGDGSAIYSVFDSQIFLVNTILSGNTPGSLYMHEAYPSALIFDHSNVEGGQEGIRGNADSVKWLEGNVDLNPGFANPEQGDYSLRGDSPLIDAGTHYFAYGGAVLVDLDPTDYRDGAPDMGIKEVLLTSVYPGDADNNGLVNAHDVLAIGMQYGEIGAPRVQAGLDDQRRPAVLFNQAGATYADANGDGIIDVNDVQGIIANWGQRSTPTGPEFFVEPGDSSSLQQHAEAFRNIYNTLFGHSEAVVAMRTLIRSVIDLDLPQRFELTQNYPNPFNATTRFQYSLAENTEIEIMIFDLRGRLVNTLENGPKAAGLYEIEWNSNDSQGLMVSSGLYFLILRTPSYTKTIKMIHLK